MVRTRLVDLKRPHPGREVPPRLVRSMAQSGNLMAPLGKAIVVIGLIVVACGFVLWAASSIPLIQRLGRLPGDIIVRRGNFTFHFPIVTSIVISVVLSLLFGLMRR